MKEKIIEILKACPVIARHTVEQIAGKIINQLGLSNNGLRTSLFSVAFNNKKLSEKLSNEDIHLLADGLCKLLSVDRREPYTQNKKREPIMCETTNEPVVCRTASPIKAKDIFDFDDYNRKLSETIRLVDVLKAKLHCLNIH